MELSTVVKKYRSQFEKRYQSRILPSHRKAMNAILRCRTPDSGEMHFHCDPCDLEEILYHSCGHRHCPHCQNNEATRWLERQLEKRLPVEYFLITFTLPRELRSRVWNNQRAGYNAMFHAVSQTLLKFGVDPKHLGAKIGFTAILHTHSRRLDYHPHIHVVIPGGGVNVEKNQWIRKSSKYLFNGRALAQVFRGKFLEQLIAQEFSIPTIDKKQWITNCKRVGHGEKALQYLSRYLYRGVISERNILTDQDGKVTFQYIDSNTKTTQTRTLPGEDFLWLIFQHILPKGFRRVRDYGLLHANSKLLIQQVQLIFQIKLKRKKEQGRPEVCCKICKQVMKLIAIMIKPATQIPPIQTIVTTGASP